VTARVVAVVGGAASGVLVAANLARGAARERSGAPLDVVVIDPRPDAGRGAAFGGNDDAHLLNVAAARMSAVPDDPDHFLRWMNTFVRPTAPAAYVPRRLYGLFLDELLQDAFDGARGRARLIRIHTRATAVSVAEPDDRRSDHRVAGVPGHHRVLVRLATGHWLGADDVVLALGSPGPGTGWAPAELLTCGRFVADPWGTDLRERIGPAREQGPTGAEPLPVLLVGSGLTAVDAALTLLAQGHRVRVVSRHGLLPSVHRPGLPLLGPAPAVPDPLTLESLEQLLANSVRGSMARFGDWRPGIDALRLVTIAL